MRHELPAGLEAARSFWRDEGLGQGRQREPWQLEPWEDAVKWYLVWLKACAEEGGDHRSLPERVRAAVNAAGSRRGLALETKKCYRSWAARYAGFAGDVRDVMREETATRFLTSGVAVNPALVETGYPKPKRSFTGAAIANHQVVENAHHEQRHRIEPTETFVIGAAIQCQLQLLKGGNSLDWGAGEDVR